MQVTFVQVTLFGHHAVRTVSSRSVPITGLSIHYLRLAPACGSIVAGRHLVGQHVAMGSVQRKPELVQPPRW